MLCRAKSRLRLRKKTKENSVKRREEERQNEMVELVSDNKKMILRETLFWDVNQTGINAHTSKSLIIERVLTRGNMDEFKQLIRFYSVQELTQNALKIGYMDGRTLNFIAEYLNLSKEDFLCYKKKLSNPGHCSF